MTARVVPDDDAGRREAIAVLEAGGIVALPTDTVYGIAVGPSTPDGLERLFAAKRRPPDKAIGVLCATAEQAAEIGIMSTLARRLAGLLWPGGVTLVLTATDSLRRYPALADRAPTIGVRVPAHPCPRALARVLGPLPTTSANLSGQPEARDPAAIIAALGDAVDLVLDGGPAAAGPASTVVDCTGEEPRVLREGTIPARIIEAIADGHGGDGPDPGAPGD